MTFEEFENARRNQLRAEAKKCFDAANAEPSWGGAPTLIAQAQFYMQELDRRHDSWVSWRDLILEVMVIFLIGWEIHLAVIQGKDEGALMDKQNRILSTLETSTQVTADQLKEQLANEYRVFINPQVTPAGDIALYNNSKSEIALWGIRIGTFPAVMHPNGPLDIAEHTVEPIRLGDYYHGRIATFPPVVYYLYLKNAAGQEFVWSGKLDTSRLSTEEAEGSLRAEQWTHSINLSRAAVAATQSSSRYPNPQ